MAKGVGYTIHAGWIPQLLKGRPSKKQLHWVESLNERNYKAVVVYGFDQAKKELDEYLNQKEFYV